MDQFFTVETLTTLGGQVLAIGIVTQVVKMLLAIPLPEVPNWITQLVAVSCGVALQLVFAPGGWGAAPVFAKVLNGLLVAMTAMKGAEFVARKG